MHISQRHPEMADHYQLILETISAPDLVQQGDAGELLAARWYDQTVLGSKNLVVAYRETDPDDGFVVTAYLTNRLSARRTTLWTH